MTGLDDYTRWIEQEEEMVLQIEKAAKAWREKWPNHCKACGGHGGSHYTQSHPYGSTSASESCFDVCMEMERDETCHRCGQDGLTKDGDGPCRFCGWNYDDGMPSY